MSSSTDLLQLAAQFVNSTASHIFLTGKAGTGKTTFLRDLAQKTHKPFVIVAPTGIAALNAQGTTIHSQFLLPMGSFLPGKQSPESYSDRAQFYNQNSLARKHPLNSIRKQVLRAAELIIIDEVSMLRADILDAIDYRMRSVKGNFNKSFGGAQVLMIGDLFQLPPIVKDHEWQVLRNYYKSMHFFEAHAVREGGLTCIELDKIFRQQDHVFIDILNNLRNNVCTSADIETLNQYYKSPEKIGAEGDVITITTHNYKADQINQTALDDLPGKTQYFEANTWGDFPENLFPAKKLLELKVGAQVMFIKNDSSGAQAYYNGKLARICAMDEDSISVVMADNQQKHALRQEKWENKKYTIHPDSKDLEEEVVGHFLQYPIKLAWAVTVHKSQGLTFDKAIIDVGQAFAPGQVYVALSRLRSLDGLILRTHISPQAISSDAGVVQFSKAHQDQNTVATQLRPQQMRYLQEMLDHSYDFGPLERALADQQDQSSKMAFEDQSMQQAIPNLQARFAKERDFSFNFRRQLMMLVQKEDVEKLMERIAKGSAYYLTFMEENLRQLIFHMADVAQFSRTKTYLTSLEEIDQLFMQSLGEMARVSHITRCILAGQEITRPQAQELQRTQKRLSFIEEAKKTAEANPKKGRNKSGRKKKASAKSKGETFKTTFSLLKEGMSVQEIAITRGLSPSTIEGHLVKGIAMGELRLLDILSQEVILDIAPVFTGDHPMSLGAAHKHFNEKYPYDVLRMVQTDLKG